MARLVKVALGAYYHLSMSAPDANSIQRATATTSVQATVDQCYAVVIDLENYPAWVEGIASVVVESRDDQDRPLNVRFEAEGLGRKASYTLRYDLSEAPHIVAWSLVAGDLARVIEGRYVLADDTDTNDVDTPATAVDYELTIDLAVPLPGFVKRRAEDKIVDAALRRFKNRVEEISSLS